MDETREKQLEIVVTLEGRSLEIFEAVKEKLQMILEGKDIGNEFVIRDCIRRTYHHFYSSGG